MANYTDESRILHCNICGVSRMHTMIVEELQNNNKKYTLADGFGYILVAGIFFMFALASSIFIIISCLLTKEPIKDAFKDAFKELPKAFSDIVNNDKENFEQHRSYECKFCGTIHPDKEIIEMKKK